MKEHNVMRSFSHLSPPLRIFHGVDGMEWLGRELELVKSQRAVIFCGASLARTSRVFIQQWFHNVPAGAGRGNASIV